jgi:multiple sugar transport system substrate-binding protein
MNTDPDTYMNVVQPRAASWWTEWEKKADRELQSMLLGETAPADVLAEWDAYWSEKYASEE